MTEAVLWKMGYLASAVIAYGLLRWRIMVITHDFRVQAGLDADALSADPRVPKVVGLQLQFWADRIYLPWTPWIVVWRTLVAVLKPIRKSETAESSAVHKEIFHVGLRLLLSAVSASPIASVVTAIILVVGLKTRRPIKFLGLWIENLSEIARLPDSLNVGYPSFAMPSISFYVAGSTLASETSASGHWAG